MDLSITAAVGGITVLVLTPLLGRLSDRTRSRFGKRRPWILGGAVVGLLGAVLLALSSQLWQVVAGWMITQAGFGAANAAVHALLAEQIPTRIRARVAAVTGAAAGLALIIGALLIAALPADRPAPWFLIPGGVGAVACALLVLGLHDLVRTEPAPPWSWRELLGTYWLDPFVYRDFFWAWTCRLFVTMSIVSVSAYLLYLIIDRLGIPRETASGAQAQALIVFTAGNIAMALLFGWISDRTGRRKPIVLVSCAISAIGLVIAILAPGLPMFLVAMLVIGGAQGAYVSVDVALMTEVLPTARDAGKDLGIIALAYQLPQLLVPVMALPLLAIGGGGNYTALYLAAIVCAVIGGLAVLPIRGVR